ncbi:MAG: hypothetical protein ABFC34_14190 [Methanobacterium sp.]
MEMKMMVKIDVNEKVIDYGTFIVGAVIIAATQVLPQVQQMYATNPSITIELAFAALVLSQIGSRIAVNQSKSTEPPE